MAVTRLERKVKRNRINAEKRQARIKQLLKKPVIKNVDIEAMKLTFTNKPAKGRKKEEENTSQTKD